MPEAQVTLKVIQPVLAVCVRDRVPTYPLIEALWREVGGTLHLYRLHASGKPRFAIFYDFPRKTQMLDVEVCAPVTGQEELTGRAKLREVQGVNQMACLTYHGAYANLADATQTLLDWIAQNGYRVTGPGREVYLINGPGFIRQNDPSYVTEIQFPVEKT